MSDSETQTSSVLVAVATYNERENLPLLVEAIFQELPFAEILVIDDASPDGTGDWAQEYAKGNSHLIPLRRAGKLGLGTAIQEAIRYAVEHQYDYLINMDADFSHPPNRLRPLLDEARSKGVDIVIGSRYVPGGKIEGWSWYRRMMSRSVNFYARMMLGLNTRDNSGAYRCYRREILQRLQKETFLSRGYSFFEEVLYRAKRSGASFCEIPITFTERIRGASKINLKEALMALLLLAKLRWN